MTARKVSPTVRRARSWLREIVVGVSGTVIGAIVLTSIGIHSDGPSTRDETAPLAQQQPLVQIASTAQLPVLAMASSLTSPPERPPATSAELSNLTPADAAPVSLLGLWEQWIYHPIEQRWYSGGIYRVAIKQQRLAMSIIDNSDVDIDVINSQGISNTQYAEGIWTFQSQLEIGELLEFKLQCADADTFSGHCYRNGEAVTANTWRRVK